jgi:hypothetical protein
MHFFIDPTQFCTYYQIQKVQYNGKLFTSLIQLGQLNPAPPPKNNLKTFWVQALDSGDKLGMGNISCNQTIVYLTLFDSAISSSIWVFIQILNFLTKTK